MKIISTVKRVSAIAMLVAGVSGGVQAAPISAVASGTGDVVFSETGTASISVTPVTGLLAGTHNALQIATAQATATGGAVAYRWTPDASVVRNGDNLQRTLSGKASALNKLDVVSTATATVSAAYPEWYVANNNASTLAITIKTSAVDQPIAADTYVVSLDAVVWAV